MPERSTILVVDGDPGTRRALVASLHSAGYGVSEASTGHEGIVLAGRERPKLVVLHLNLPDIQGPGACHEFRQRGVEVPILAISASLQQTQHRIAVLESGASLHPGMPTDPQEFVAHVRSLLRGREAEWALREREAEFRAIFEANVAGIAESSCATRQLLRVNAAFCELTGYTEEELLSRTVNDLNWPEDREWDLKQYELALQTGRYEVEKRYLRKDGRPVWVHASGSILRDERGRPVRTVVVVKDVTESRAAAERLRESEMRLRMAMEAAFLISFEWDILRDEVRRFVSTEPALPATKENAPDTYEGVRRCVHPEDRERFSENVEAALRSESGLYRNEYRVVRPDGGLSWVSESGRVERDASGKPVRLVGLSQDITERKAAEQELRETTERLRAVLENSLDAAYRRDLRTDTYDYLSPVVEEVLGMTPEELRGLSVGEFLARMHPEDRARAVEAIESGMRLLKGRVEYRIRLRDGRYRWVADHFKVQTDEGGRPIYRSGIVRDAEERKRAEERLRQQEAELRAHTHDLERLVQERTAKLTELVGELEHFSYSITHDMRAPLRAMRGFADLAAEMSKDTPHPEVKGLLQRIMTSAERMDLLITDALNYSKAVREELPLGPVDVLALLRGMLDTYPEFQQHRANIQVTREMPCVLGNEAGLTQCFSNLLGNAIKFTAKGVPPVVRVWSEVRGEWVRIWVEDNGIGIPPALLPKLFQMFTRGAAGYEGTGIGLALVRKVVQRMGGYVGVESESDRGSRFWVELRTAPTGRTHAAISAESAETD